MKMRHSILALAAIFSTVTFAAPAMAQHRQTPAEAAEMQKLQAAADAMTKGFQKADAAQAKYESSHPGTREARLRAAQESAQSFQQNENFRATHDSSGNLKPAAPVQQQQMCVFSSGSQTYYQAPCQ